MLATRVRVSPCSERCTRESVGRSTVTVPSARLMRMAAGIVRARAPRSPLTLTWLPSTVTSTPGGTVIGILPMRDTGSPHVGDDFAAQLGALRGAPGHQSVRGRDDGDAQPAEHAGDLTLARVDAQARPADAAQPGQSASLGVRRLERDAEHLLRCLTAHRVRLDEPLLAEHARDLHLHPR